MKREISYLQANMYYFVYHITTIALYWQEKSTLLMNENKRIDNPWIRIVKCVGVKAQDENMHLNTTKTNSGHSFQYTKFSVIELVLTKRRNLSGTCLKIGLWQSSSSQICSQPGEMPLSKPLNMKLSFFSFSVIQSHTEWKALTFKVVIYLCFWNEKWKEWTQRTQLSLSLITKHIMEKLFYSTNGTIWPNYNLAEKINKMLHEKF